MEYQKRTKVKNQKNGKYKIRISSIISILVLILVGVFFLYHIKESTTSINIQGETAHAYAENNSENKYEIEYIYSTDENNMITQCEVKITIPGGYLNSVPDGWTAESQSMMSKIFTENGEWTITDKDYNNGGTQAGDIKISITQIGEEEKVNGKIHLENKPTEDTFINKNGTCLVYVSTEDILIPGNIQVNLKIGNEINRIGTLDDLGDRQAMDNWIITLNNLTGNGRITLEIPPISGVFNKTVVLDTKYIVDNTAPNPSVGAGGVFKEGKERVTMQLDEPVNIVEDGQTYEINYNDDGLVADIQSNSGGWEKGQATYLAKWYETPGDKTIRVIDRAGNYKDITFNIKGWISDIKLNTLGGTYKEGETITVIAKYIGDDISESTTKSKLKYSIGTGEVKEVEETSKDVQNKTITYTINIDQNDIGKLKYESISIRTNKSFQPDFSSITVKQLTGIEIAKSSEFKLTYTEGERLDLTGLTVTVKYSDNSSEEIDTTQYIVSPANGTILTETGTNTVTVTYKGKIATCDVTVIKNTSGGENVAVTGVSLNKTTATIKVGQTESLTATITPANATNKNITWESSDENIAKVVDGVITGVSEGIADITVITEDGNKVATCKVTVTKSTPNPDDHGNNNNGNNNGNNSNNSNNNNNNNNNKNNNSQNTNKTNTIENDTKVSASKLPYAGLKESIMIISIISLIIVAIISYIKYKRCM